MTWFWQGSHEEIKMQSQADVQTHAPANFIHCRSLLLSARNNPAVLTIRTVTAYLFRTLTATYQLMNMIRYTAMNKGLRTIHSKIRGKKRSWLTGNVQRTKNLEYLFSGPKFKSGTYRLRNKSSNQ